MKEFLNQLAQDKIAAAIGQAEKKTSGEIRVFITRHEPADVIAAAQEHFNELGMTKTKEGNGVLIFVAPRIRKFAVIGDAGVHQRCGDEFWTATAAEMSNYFKRAEFTEGIIHGVSKAGDLLAKHFPHRRDDTNELPNEVAQD